MDPYPIPKDKTPLCINEPWLIDKSLLEYPPRREPDEKEDNVHIYVPIQKLLEGEKKTPKIVYLNCLHSFGKDKGLVIYNKMKACNRL